MTVQLPVQVPSFKDSAGKRHETMEMALTAEIERLLGRVGDGNGGDITLGIAKKIVEEREGIMAYLAAMPAPNRQASQSPDARPVAA